MAYDDDLLPLASAIAALRAEIRAAAAHALLLPEQERFRITEAELELTVVAEYSAKGGAEIGWWVFKATAEVQGKESSTHKVRLKLNIGDVEVGSDVRAD